MHAKINEIDFYFEEEFVFVLLFEDHSNVFDKFFVSPIDVAKVFYIVQLERLHSSNSIRINYRILSIYSMNNLKEYFRARREREKNLLFETISLKSKWGIEMKS